MDLIEQYGLLVLSLFAGFLVIWRIYRLSNNKGAKGADFFLFGPFAKGIGNYLNARGGFTKRETIGWGIVVLTMLLIIIAKLLAPNY